MKNKINPNLLIMYILLIYKIVIGKKTNQPTYPLFGGSNPISQEMEQDKITIFYYNIRHPGSRNINTISSSSYDNIRDLKSVKIGAMVNFIQVDDFYGVNTLEKYYLKKIKNIKH